MSKNTTVDELFSAGAHYAHKKSRRHPSTQPYLYGTKDRTELFDLEKTQQALGNALELVEDISASRKQLLFVSSKHEAREIIRTEAQRVHQPFVASRWIGGTLTNFEQIRKRIDKMQESIEKRDRGEFEKYTKKEQLLLDREINSLQNKFGGLVSMEKLPGALFIIDVKEEDIAFKEAHARGIPVVSVSGSDCDISDVEYPIPANDSSRTSIEFFVKHIADAYERGVSKRKTKEQPTSTKETETKEETSQQSTKPKETGRN